MLEILSAYCDVNGDESYSTCSLQRVTQAWVNFVSTTVGKREGLPQKLLLHVMQLSSRLLQETEDGSCQLA